MSFVVVYYYLKTAPQPQVYGVELNLFGNNGYRIYEIYYSNGAENGNTSKPIKGVGVAQGSTINVLGIARKVGQVSGQNEAIFSAVEANNLSSCGNGTAFYDVDLNTGSATKLGTAKLGPDFNIEIKDIEFNPVDGNLYGIYQDRLVRVEKDASNSYGAPCFGSNQGTSAIITCIGTLTNIGQGPYSVSFDHLGTCYIISARDHKVAKAIIPSSPSCAPLSYTGAIYHDASIPNINPGINNSDIEVASCVSGTTLVIGVSDPDNGKSFYHWGTNNWTKKGNYCVRDYTSTAKSLSIFK